MSSILIVGSGLAGLACAWRLRRAGFDVEVLECAKAPGGRTRSDLVSGCRLETGASRADGDHPQLRALARELGLPTPIANAPERRFAILRDGRFESIDVSSTRALLGAHFLSLPGRLRGARLGIELARRWNDLDPSMPQAQAALDHRVAAQALAQLAGSELRDQLILPLLGAIHPGEVETFSEAYLQLALRSLLEPDASRGYLEGGLSSLIAPLAASIPIRLGCEVTSVESFDEGVRVRYRIGERTGSALADAAVVALPGDLVSGICPKLTPLERGFFDGVQYCEGIEAHLVLDRAPVLPADLLVLPRDRGFGVAGVLAAHRLPGAAPPGRGLLRAVLRESAAIRMREVADDVVTGVVLDNLSRTPLGRVSPETVVVHRLARRLPRLCPGSIAALARFRRRVERSPRLAFCGDYLIGPWSGASVISGLRAASELVNGLSQRQPRREHAGLAAPPA